MTDRLTTRFQTDDLYRSSFLLAKIWRRRPDLNRGWRFCRPLPYHLATAPAGNDLLKQESSGRVYARRQQRARGRVRSVISFCGPPSPLACQPKLTLRLRCVSEGWSGKRDSNPRLRPWQGRTLPLSYSRPRRNPSVPRGFQPNQGSLVDLDAFRRHRLQQLAELRIERVRRPPRVAIRLEPAIALETRRVAVTAWTPANGRRNAVIGDPHGIRAVAATHVP